MYWTQRSSRASGGRYDMRMYFPIDGPIPAEVTYERRPVASTIGDPSARTIGSRSIGVYSSQPRSPTYEMRDAITPLSSSCHVEKGNASFETSVPVIEARTSRARGPQMPTVQTDEV